LVVAIASSAIVSLTLTPMLCSHLLGRRNSGAVRGKGRLQLMAAAGYARSLDWTLRHRASTLLLTFGGDRSLRLALSRSAKRVHAGPGYRPISAVAPALTVNLRNF
jgi:Cu/Ag efflux pump CusA